MILLTERTDPTIAQHLLKGDIGVIKTDTLYGVVARAADKAAVERVYSVRERDNDKPCIILIADETQLFDTPSAALKEFMQKHWPGPVSIIVPSPSAPTYLTRGGKTLAYRMPDDAELRELLYTTGPLIAPSANPQGEPPAKDIHAAQEYFGASVDFYADSGEVQGVQPSQLWTYQDNTMKRLRWPS